MEMPDTERYDPEGSRYGTQRQEPKAYRTVRPGVDRPDRAPAESGVNADRCEPWRLWRLFFMKIADVSAIGDPATGVAYYDRGWKVVGGTSVSAPIISGIVALSA